ncbi:hypothetical protein QBC40DRAFT_248984 [Triangularia verruculosa]|uniref:Uncharacterized protein n=1 Tax=Triangularia verruculosa TaxID=2587418 RepID=A0AAN7B0J2_9PEZI|nr:hypothetical protein QBC40DRAFT_248984 [Triangularia verruculosa]
MAGGVLTVSTNAKCPKRTTRLDDDDADNSPKSERDFVGNLTFRPTGSQSVITLMIHQGQRAFGTVLSVPNLFIKNILPQLSEGFRLAQKGVILTGFCRY